MASTEVQICNLALARIGVKDFIESMGEQTTEGLACNTLYAQTRDSLLTSMPWPFATKRQALAVTTDVERDGWAYNYALPSDCLMARSIWMGERAPSAENKVPFTLELNDAGTTNILLSDKEDAELVYTVKVTNPLLFPPLFVECLAWKLAAELAMPLAVRSDLRSDAQKMAMAMETRATAVAFTEQFETAPTTPSIAARD